MDGEGIMNSQDGCYGGASLAGAVIGTFLTTILLLAVAAIVYRQWRRHKGKHLVLVTNPEIVEDAYAFDNPCFKDATPAVSRNHDTRPLSTASLTIETTPTTKDSARWSTPWSSLVFAGNSVNKNDRRRTLDDSCLGSKATRVSVVSLRSRDFTGLGFNVCGNMREGIFVKDLLHRGPASESGRINPGDRIASVKISFRSMVYEDALTILSYASPYDVELEVESGGSVAGSRPTTLLKKTIGPSPSRICHPLYRSQSIPELSQAQQKTTAKRLFIADPNETMSSNNSTMNSTLKSCKSTPGSQTLERRHEEARSQNHQQQQQQHHHHHHHHKFGIKVLPALDGTVHRIENQNEHNTNLERRNSRKTDMENEAIGKIDLNSDKNDNSMTSKDRAIRDVIDERYQKRENSRKHETPTLKFHQPMNNHAVAFGDGEKKFIDKTCVNGNDVTDLSSKGEKTMNSAERYDLPSEVPAEVHNAAMAAQRNRKNSMEMLKSGETTMTIDNAESTDRKSPQKNKRKAPAPPIVFPPVNNENVTGNVNANRINERNDNPDDIIESITDYVESLDDYVGKIRDDNNDEMKQSKIDDSSSNDKTLKRHETETDSDNDSEIHDSFTTIELKPADITIHHTPFPQGHSVENKKINDNDDDAETDDVYRKAASLGDLSKYENKSLVILERAQSLDMVDAGMKKRKHLTPDDINESTEDLTKIEDPDNFVLRKLKKSIEWGKLEDAIWKRDDKDGDENLAASSRKRERSNSAKEAEENNEKSRDSSGRILPNEISDDTSLELYNLPLSIRLTREFVRNERIFNPDEDNSLARIVNNGRIVKSPTPDDVELDFRRATPKTLATCNDVDIVDEPIVESVETSGLTTSPSDDEFHMALRYFDREINRSLINDENGKIDDDDNDNDDSMNIKRDSLYHGKPEIHEEPMKKVQVKTGCPGCDMKYSHGEHNCERNRRFDNNGDMKNRDNVDWQPQEVSKLSESPTASDGTSLSAFKIGLTKFERNLGEMRSKSVSPTESKIEKKLLRERGIDIDDIDDDDADDDEKTNGKTNNDVGRKSFIERDSEDEEGYDFGTEITINSKIMSSPVIDRHNVSNVSVSSGENSEDSGLVGESGDYARQDSELKPPLPDTPIPISGSQKKLTYITEINVSTSKDNTMIAQQERGDISRREHAKPARNDGNLTSNGKGNSVKKPPVPPRRNDTSKLQSRDYDTSEKHVVYVSEYKSSNVRDKSENTENISTINQNDDTKLSGNKKFKNWIYLDDSKDQNP